MARMVMNERSNESGDGGRTRRRRREALGGRLAGRTVLGGLTLAVTVHLASGGAVRAQDGADLVDRARATLERWVETRRVLSRERQDWEVGRQTLEDRIELVKSESEAVAGRLAEARESIAQADEKRAALVEEDEELKAVSASLAEVVAGLEERTRALLRRLPDPLRETVKPLSQRLPAAGEDPAELRLSLGERFQNVIGILNEVEKFHREVRVTSEVRPLGNGTTAEVTALYLGLSQGYYVSADGLHAGVGQAGPEGWEWRAADEAARAVADAVAILQNEKVAEFVGLPIRIDRRESDPR